jgi:hypothetical protein
MQVLKRLDERRSESRLKELDNHPALGKDYLKDTYTHKFVRSKRPGHRRVIHKQRGVPEVAR